MPEQVYYAELLFNDCCACDPASKVNWRTTGLFLCMTTSAPSRRQLAAYQVEPALIWALIHAEFSNSPGGLPQQIWVDLTDARHHPRAGVGNAPLAEQNIFGG